MLTENDIQRIGQRIVEGYAPLAMGIFGSYAVGAAHERSDLDIFAISHRGGDLAARVLSVKRLLFGILHPTDVFVFTPQEFEEAARVEESFAWVIVQQTRLLHWTDGATRYVPSLAAKGVLCLAKKRRSDLASFRMTNSRCCSAHPRTP
jgi:predicted nucleotidyltransferase